LSSTRVLATTLSVTLRYCIKMAKHM